MRLLKNIYGFLFPAYCVACGERLINSNDPFCIRCNVKLPRTYQWRNPYDNNLARRFWGRMDVRKCVSYIYHLPHTGSAQIVYDFKYNERGDVARRIGEIMADEIGATAFFDDIECIVPVPITQQRRRLRGYNQSEELAKGISKKTGIPVITTALKRVEGIDSQIKQTKRGRIDNISGAFFATENALGLLKGKHVLLLDDVITTGSTLAECASALKGIPEITFSVISFASVKG